MSKGAAIEKARASTRTSNATSPRRPSLIPLADSYLLWSVVGSTLRGLGWFAGLFLAFAVVTGARSVAQRGIPISIALEAVALQAPRIVLFTIPASLLFGVVSTFTEMSSKGEVTALMAGGMGLRRMIRGPLVLAICLGVFAFWLQEVVVPGAELRKGALMVKAAKNLPLDDGFKIIDPPKGPIRQIIQAASFNIEEKTLSQPVVQVFRPDHTIEVQIQADSARWDSANKAWILKNAKTLNNPQSNPQNRAKNGALSVYGEFPEMAIKTSSSPEDGLLKSADKDVRQQIEDNNFEMVSWQQLAADRAEKIQEFRKPATTKEQKDARKSLRKQIRAETYGIHDKWATPLIVIAMVLFGAPLGVRPQRTASAGLAMGLSLMVIMGYYLLWTFCTQAGKGGMALPEVLAYLPTVVMSGLGTILIARKS